ncbi:MAG: Ig-like domain-containing protein [Clostridia bacterium]|nr:Ig-like domain-containing protein [Clostridia bacterium]
MDEKEILSGLSAEEQERLRKIEKLDSNQKRKKLIFAGVTVFLIALFVFGTVFGAKYILSYEGSEALPAEPLGKPDLSAVSFGSELAALVADTENYASVKVERRNRVSIPDESIKVEAENVDAQRFFGFVKSGIEDKLSGLYEKNDCDSAYGEDFSSYIPDMSAVFAGLGKTQLELNEDNETELIAKISFDAVPFDKISSSPVMAVFDLDDADELRDGAVELFSTAADISDVDIEYGGFTVTAYISRFLKEGAECRRLERLVFDRKCLVSLTAQFTGELAPYGKQDISFEADISEEYRFTRVSFEIAKDEYFIEKGDSDEINKRVVSDESVQNIKVLWTSSDESVLTVDEKGFFKGRSVSDKPVTVTGSYTYNGVTYTDECLFYVRVPAESVKLSEKELSLKTGDQRTLEATVEPEKATYKDVFWFSTDESVVTVENGTLLVVWDSGVFPLENKIDP